MGSNALQRLRRYQEKRDFSKTKEPSGETISGRTTRLRYVIQKHAATRLHYDLRLELDGVFKSWAVTKGPSLDPAAKRLAVEVEDHPLDYGDFEGTIPKGEYGGGTVQVWDRGYWTPEGLKPPEQALHDGDLKFILDGQRLHGSWVLVRMKHDRAGGKRTNWLLIKHQDAAADATGGASLLEQDASVASGRSMAHIAAGTGRTPKPFMREQQTTPRKSTATKTQAATRVRSIPSFVEPQLAKLVDKPPTEEGWAHEVKFDGYRTQLRVVKGQAVLRTRKGLDWTERFSAIAKDAHVLPDCLIDGEIVALDHHEIPSFAALQTALSAGNSESLIFFAFDLLFSGLIDLRSLPLVDRKAQLEKLLASSTTSDRLRYVQHFESRADTVLQSACKMEMEGIVSKKLDARYVSGRAGLWTKAKCHAGHEVVLGGWTHEGGVVRSLLAGVHRGGRLAYIGRIGTGYSAAIVESLSPSLKKYTQSKSPFLGDGAPASDKNVRWLKPVLVAEIKFAGWTGSGMIRQASFKGLRKDKPASEVIAEMSSPTDAVTAPSEALAAAVNKTPKKLPKVRNTVSAAAGNPASVADRAMVMNVAISKPDKALWTDAGDSKPVTKLDLALYLEAIGAWLLPHVAGRPCSLLRAPDGVKGQTFFQRHAMAGMSNVFGSFKMKGDRAPYVAIERIEALVALAQMGALEIHPANGAVQDAEVAGRLVFDLDPAADVSFDAVIVAALEIRSRLTEVGLESFCKTTGGKGLHVVTPLTYQAQDAVKWAVAKNFAHIVCAQMSADSPQKYLDTMSKSQRTGRIFLDYLRNDRLSTAVAPLSPRARQGAPVSMPITWSQVKKGLDPLAYTVRTAPSLLKKIKPWQDYDHAARSLATAIECLTTTSTKKTPTVKKKKRR